MEDEHFDSMPVEFSAPFQPSTEAWTESQWFLDWLRLARGEHPSQNRDEGQMLDQAA